MLSNVHIGGLIFFLNFQLININKIAFSLF